MQGSLNRDFAEPVGVRCEVEVDNGELPGEHCQLLGLVIAELVTNAAKHAFRERKNGLVRVELIRKADAWLCVVSDGNGDAVSAGPPGLGLRIVEQLTRALGGHCAGTSGQYGTCVAVTCPTAVSAAGDFADVISLHI